MKMWLKKMNKHGMHLLNAGETVESAVPTQSAGSMNGTVSRQLGGIVGAAVNAAVSRNKDGGAAPAGLAESIPSSNAVYVITDQRLAVITYTAMGAKPKDLVASYDYGQIAGVEMKKGKLASTISLTFNDNSVGVFEIPRMGKPDKFVDALEAKIGR